MILIQDTYKIVPITCASITFTRKGAEYENKLLKFRNSLNNDIRHAKQEYLYKKFHTLKNDIKETWKYLNEIMK